MQHKSDMFRRRATQCRFATIITDRSWNVFGKMKITINLKHFTNIFCV